MKHYQTLVLNSDGSPLSIIPWDQAFSLVHIKKVCAEIDFYQEKIKDSKGVYYTIPAVVILYKYVKRRTLSVAFNKRNVFVRDDYTCQYCGRKFKDGFDLTFDHVIPRSHKHVHNGHSPTTWKNIVSACFKCNQFKGNRTVEEAGMKLLKKPTVPTRYEIPELLSTKKIPEEWRKYAQKRKL